MDLSRIFTFLFNTKRAYNNFILLGDKKNDVYFMGNSK